MSTRANGTLTIGAMTRQRDGRARRDGRRVRAAPRASGAAHRSLPDPQPRHRRRLARARRPRVGVPGRRARARGRARGRLGRAATRRVPAAEFFVGTWTTCSRDDELLVAVHVPVWDGRCGFAFDRGRAPHGDFALAGVAAAVELGRRRRRAARAPRPARHGPHRGARARGRGRARSGDTPERAELDEVAQLAVADARPARRRARVRRVPPPGRCAPRAPGVAVAPRGTRRPGAGSERARDLGDGQRHAVSTARRGRANARRLPPRGLRAHRHAPRVRARRLRRVHRPRRRRGRARRA